MLSPENFSAYSYALSLLDGQKAAHVIADKGYDPDEIANEVGGMGAEPAIPSQPHRNTPRDYGKHLYEERNLIERMFCRLKQFRRIASRYDKIS